MTLVLGLLLVGVAIGLAAYTALADGPAVVRLSRDALPDRSSLGALATKATSAMDRTLDRSGRRSALEAKIEDAGLTIRAGEALLAVGAATFLGLVFGGMLAGPALGLLFAIAPVAIGYVALGVLRDKRRDAFATQLHDLLQMMAGSLRAGHALVQATESAASELEAPAGEELRRVLTEVRLGRDLTDAFERMADRMHSEDFAWVVQAVRIHRDVGGNLSDLLDRVAETIRARDRLRRQVRALSAEGRVSAIVLFVLPIALGAFMAVSNGAYIGLLFTTGAGLVMLAIGAVLMAIGGLWLRQIVRPVF